jgi:hypothetical protein
MTPPVSQAKVGNSTARWMQARERLTQDVDAELDDLLGPQFQYPEDRDLRGDEAAQDQKKGETSNNYQDQPARRDTPERSAGGAQFR